MLLFLRILCGTKGRGREGIRGGLNEISWFTEAVRSAELSTWAVDANSDDWETQVCLQKGKSTQSPTSVYGVKQCPPGKS